MIETGDGTSKRVLIFGGAGSLGTTLTRCFLSAGRRVFVASRDEAKHWALRSAMHRSDADLSTILCDIRDRQRVEDVSLTIDPDLVIIASALKQVDTCERYPTESISTNVHGVENVLHALSVLERLRPNDRVCCFVSTDKACDPINVYGMSKALSERLVVRASQDLARTRCVVVRYGNVLDSTGSVVPSIRRQGESPACTELTMTDGSMTRFMMTLDQSVALIIQAITKGDSGQIWIPMLDSMKISDLFDFFSERYGKPVRTVGIRPGEKVHEVLCSETELLHLRCTERKTSSEPWPMAHMGTMVVDMSGQPTPVTGDNVRAYSSGDHVIGREELWRRMIEFLAVR